MIKSMSITKSVKNKRFLIWNFMHELLNKHEEAIRRGSSTVFNIGDFSTIKLPVFQYDSSFMRDTLLDYQHATEFIRISNGTVALTSKGILHSRFGKDWD